MQRGRVQQRLESVVRSRHLGGERGRAVMPRAQLLARRGEPVRFVVDDGGSRDACSKAERFIRTMLGELVAPSWLLLLQLSLLALDLPLDVGAAAKQGDPDREYDDQQEA